MSNSNIINSLSVEELKVIFSEYEEFKRTSVVPDNALLRKTTELWCGDANIVSIAQVMISLGVCVAKKYFHMLENRGENIGAVLTHTAGWVLIDTPYQFIMLSQRIIDGEPSFPSIEFPVSRNQADIDAARENKEFKLVVVPDWDDYFTIEVL